MVHSSQNNDRVGINLQIKNIIPCFEAGCKNSAYGLRGMKFNLKTDAYRGRFPDACGRDAVNTERFPVIAAIEAFG